MSDVVFYVCAHTDDALLFRGEGLYTDLHTAGVTTVQVLLTADDAGRTDGWWEAHEAACIESMAASEGISPRCSLPRVTWPVEGKPFPSTLPSGSRRA